MMRPFAPRWMACAGPAALAGLVAPPQAAADTPRPTTTTTTTTTRPHPRTVPVAADEAEREALHCLQEGRAAAARGALDEAVPWFDRALRLEPAMGVAHLCRALCLLDLGRDDDAAHALGLAMHHAPAEPHARVGMARVCAAAGMTPVALDLLGGALAARPSLSGDVLADPAFAALRDHPHLLQMAGAL
jgi:Flp pilus assembly protein TadD